MRQTWIAMVLVIAACSSARSSESPSPIPDSAPATVPGATPTSPSPSSSPIKDSVTLERERYVAEVRQQIAGKETLPASQVCKNIKMI